MSAPHHEWWTDLYDGRFEAVMRRARSDEEMRRIAGFLVEALHLTPGSVLFDQCCGTGRIGSLLAARGMRVVGVERNELDLAEGGLRMSWTSIMPDGARDEIRGYIRLYLPHQLEELMEEAGFEAVAFYGGVDGSSLSTDSSRCILVGQKPPS